MSLYFVMGMPTERAARAGVDKIQNDQQRNNDQHDADGESGRLLDAGDAHSAVDQHLAVYLQIQGGGILQ